MENNIAVLGRGYSLKKYKKYSHLFEKIYIVGRFYREIEKLGIKHFKNKKIIHVVSRTDTPLKNNLYKKLNVRYVQICFHSLKQFIDSHGKDLTKKYPKNVKLKALPECVRDRGYPPLPSEDILKYCSEYDNYKDLCKYLQDEFPNEIKKIQKETRRTRYWPTAGLVAIDVALNENDLDKLYLFGIDNYTNITYVLYKLNEFKKPYINTSTELVFYHIYQLVKEFPNIQFYSSSPSEKFDFDLPNWYLF